MYQNCIFCAANLGNNDSIEEFPVGKALAFDSWKGRLWAICPRCHRWNLAPIELRWEAVERAEESFRASGLRVQAEAIGLAQLRDGTRLVRVGDALPGELAAWRYGRELRQRRRRYWMELGFTTIAALTVGIPVFFNARRRKEVIYQIPSTTSPSGKELLVRRHHLDGAEFRIVPADAGLSLRIPRHGLLFRRIPKLELSGVDARTILERTLVGVNQRGASERNLVGALALLDGAGSAEEYVGNLGGSAELRIRERLRSGLWRCEWTGPDGQATTRIGAPRTLALEMALHEETERRALEGELVELEARWREAEEIAQIADAL